MNRIVGAIMLAAAVVTLYYFVEREFNTTCPSIAGPSYVFATKLPHGEEQDKNPTYVEHSGGYVFEQNLSNYPCTQIRFSFKAVHYALDFNVASIRIEVFGGDGMKIGSITKSVEAQMQDWRDINNLNKYALFRGEIKTSSKIAKVKVFAVPGNQAVILRDVQFN